MKTALKYILLLGVSLLVAGCKLAVIVVEGGDVQSTRSGTCGAGTVCIIEVTEAGFSEVFTAVPDTGWYFHKWNSGDRLFCGGSANPICTLSFQGHEDSEEVEEMVASSEVFYLMPVFREVLPFIEVDGNLWAQPGLFLNLSWNDIEAACPGPSGLCSGELNGVDMNGWTWASVEEVGNLFNHYINASGDDLPLTSIAGGFDTMWASAFYGDGWLPTNSSNAFRAIFGWTRTKAGPDKAYVGVIIDALVYNPEGNPDAATTERTQSVGESSEITGSWFYQER